MRFFLKISIGHYCRLWKLLLFFQWEILQKKYLKISPKAFTWNLIDANSIDGRSTVIDLAIHLTAPTNSLSLLPYITLQLLFYHFHLSTRISTVPGLISLAHLRLRKLLDCIRSAVDHASTKGTKQKRREEHQESLKTFGEEHREEHREDSFWLPWTP